MKLKHSSEDETSLELFQCFVSVYFRTCDGLNGKSEMVKCFLDDSSRMMMQEALVSTVLSVYSLNQFTLCLLLCNFTVMCIII